MARRVIGRCWQLETHTISTVVPMRLVLHRQYQLVKVGVVKDHTKTKHGLTNVLGKSAAYALNAVRSLAYEYTL